MVIGWKRVRKLSSRSPWLLVWVMCPSLFPERGPNSLLGLLRKLPTTLAGDIV